MKTHFLSFIYLFFINLPIINIAQPKMVLKGRVFEMVKGKPTGISNISVYIQDQNVNYDITNERGEFTIPFSTDKNFVFINFDKTFNHQLISPRSGRVALPVPNSVDVIVCGKENKRLRDEVDKLNQKVKSFQTKYQLSEKKAAQTYAEMLDTILHYEQRIQALDAQKEKLQAQSNAEIQRLQTEIDRLKLVEESLLRQLLEAKDEKFKKKQDVFQKIAAGLRRYSDELQNLNNMLMPEQISLYFTYDNRSAVNKLTEKNDAYNAAYHGIDDNRDGNITAVRHYWEDEDLVNQLTETYQYLLVDVHEKIVYPMNSTVIDAIKKWSGKHSDRVQLERKAKESSLDAMSKIKVKNTLLLDKINETINLLKQNF